MKRTKICYVSPLSIHSYRWIEAFSQKGYDTSLISDSNAWVAPEVTFIPFYPLSALTWTNFLLRLPSNYSTIIKILKRVNPDFVHLHAQHHYWLPIVRGGFPFVLTTWGAEVLKLPASSFLRRTIARSVGREAQMITVDALCLKDIWVSIGVPEEKVRVIPFGVDVNLFNPDVDGSPVRKNLQIGRDDVVVISTRPFYNAHYNVECLIRAIPLIIEKCENVKFIIKGVGPLENYLKRLARNLGVHEHVRFVGLISFHEVAQYMAAADIYVSTCFIDSTSVSLLEAMACGLSPVVTDIPGNREWIENGENGFLFPPKIPAALAEKVAQLIENHSLRRVFGERCWEIVRQRASWEKCVSQMEDVYRMLMCK